MIDMELSPISPNNAGMRRDPRSEDHIDEEDRHEDDAPADLYEALGYRKPVYPSITTQQWIEKRFIIESIFA